MIEGFTGIGIAYSSLIFLNLINFVTNISPNLQVLFQTPVIVYIGCIHSIRLYSKTTDTKKEGIETMTKKDAMLFPVIAGSTLGALFLAFKFLDKDLVNVIFHFYFTLIGTFVIATFLYNRTKETFVNLSKRVLFEVPKIKFISDVPVPFDMLYIANIAASIPIGIAYYLTKHYMLNNVLGIFFSLIGIESFLIGSSTIGFILLGALFFYDIYFVFFTPLMVTVAKSLEGPIKLMFPKIFDWSEQKDFNMIGLGDIVIPGIYVALMLRYDYIRCINNKKVLHVDAKGNNVVSFTFENFRTFLLTFVGYFVGILSTLVIMNVFQAAQPALLYLVPGVLIFSAASAFFGGYFNDFSTYDENISMKMLGLVEEEKAENKQN